MKNTLLTIAFLLTGCTQIVRVETDPPGAAVMAIGFNTEPGAVTQWKGPAPLTFKTKCEWGDASFPPKLDFSAKLDGYKEAHEEVAFHGFPMQCPPKVVRLTLSPK